MLKRRALVLSSKRDCYAFTHSKMSISAFARVGHFMQRFPEGVVCAKSILHGPKIVPMTAIKSHRPNDLDSIFPLCSPLSADDFMKSRYLTIFSTPPPLSNLRPTQYDNPDPKNTDAPIPTECRGGGRQSRFPKRVNAVRCA